MDLRLDNAFGFTEINGDEQFIQIHNDLNESDYVITLLHESTLFRTISDIREWHMN